MCGIVGYIANDRLDGRKMLDTIRHRGPDNSGIFEESFNGLNIFLGHQRLSILDVSNNGNQPMFSKEKNVVLCFNGEVYNFQKLAHEHLRGVVLKSNCDTEVILELYLKMGLDFIDKLIGDFAISILDHRKQELYLIRDRLGVKPLYYYNCDSNIVFGSEIKPIINSGIKYNLDNNQIPLYFSFKYSPGNQTLFKEIKRVAPASILTFSLKSKKLSKQVYWTANATDLTNYTYAQKKEQLYSLVESSIKSQLISDVPIGNFLSGGVDSSIIAHFIKNRADIQHYCAKKEKTDLVREGTTSDFKYAQELANTWGLSLSPIEINSENASLNLIRKTLHFSDDLIADGSQIPSYLITKEASKTSKVLLSGMGADEIFFGYAGHQLALLTSVFDSLPSILSNPITKLFRNLDQGNGSFKAYRRYLHKFGKYYNQSSLKYGIYSLVGDFTNSNSIFQLNTESVEAFLQQYFSQDKDPFESLQNFERENFLVKNLHYTDRMSMANSVETRVPLLNHELVEFAYGLSRQDKLSNTGVTKKILKDTFQPHLPKNIISRRKAGFGMPLRSIFSSEIKINELLELDFFNQFDTFSRKNTEQVIKNHIAGKEDNSSIIYSLISFQEWYKIYFS